MSRGLETALAEDSPRFVDRFFPLLVSVSPKRWTDRSLGQLTEGYERLFARGERYALITCAPRNATMSPLHRKRVVDWLATPRVRAKSRELCVANSTVVRGPVARGTLTALLWMWRPEFPYAVDASLEPAFDFCFEHLHRAGLTLPRSPEFVRRELLATLSDV